MMRFSVPRLASCQPLALVWALAAVQVAQAAPPTYPVTEGQRGKAQEVATAGVALSELAPDAPESYTVKRGDTLWDISKLFLRNAWRWPELWGMNLEEIRNPHLIYPGQMLYLDKSSGRARLRMGKPVGMAGGPVKLSPRVRDLADNGAIPAVPMEVIEPFLNEAVILDADELERSPRLVAAPEGRALMSRGDLAYVRGPSGQQRDWRVFRQPRALKDPVTQEVLGYEAVYVGTAEQLRVGSETKDDKGQADIVPATFRVTSTRLEAGVGDRFAPVPSRDFSVYGPHAPANAVAGKVVSVYGEAVNAGQNQIVTLNMGSKDGMERGHVLALWTEGRELIDKTDPEKARIRLPDERHGLLYVFRVFNRMSYALILTVQQPVRVGDRFTQP
jgi:LysM domain